MFVNFSPFRAARVVAALIFVARSGSKTAPGDNTSTGSHPTPPPVVAPSMVLSTDSIAVVLLDAISLLSTRGSDGVPGKVSITNGGTGTLGRLSVGAIAYSAGASEWLTTTIDSSTAPATVTLFPTARCLATGTYTATVPILSGAAGVTNSPRSVTVTFVVIPKPSTALIVVPSTIRATVQRPAGTTASFFYRIGTSSVTTISDNPLGHMAFANASSFTGPTIVPSLSCRLIGNFDDFTTPCTLDVAVSIAPNSPLGTFTSTFTIESFTSGYSATVTVVLTVTP